MYLWTYCLLWNNDTLTKKNAATKGLGSRHLQQRSLNENAKPNAIFTVQQKPGQTLVARMYATVYLLIYCQYKCEKHIFGRCMKKVRKKDNLIH